MKLPKALAAAISKMKLPEELAQAFTSLQESMQERAEPLDASPQGQDIISLWADVREEVGRELAIFIRSLGARQYHARVFAFHQQKKGKRLQWSRTSMHLAEPDYLPGGLDHLQALMRSSMEEGEGKAIAIWVHPAPTFSQDGFFVYAMHKEGLEAGFLAGGDGWSPLNMGPGPLRITMEMLVRPSSRSKDTWAQLASVQACHMRDNGREDLNDFWLQQTGSALTDDTWDALITAWYARAESVHTLQEIARVMGDSQLNESQNLLGVTVKLIDNALEKLKGKMEANEKQHIRAMTRFKTDLAVFKSERDVARKRTKQLEREKLELSKQLQAAGSGNSPQTGHKSVGLALDRFFA